MVNKNLYYKENKRVKMKVKLRTFGVRDERIATAPTETIDPLSFNFITFERQTE